MPVPDNNSFELIQKYLDGMASEAELAELERRLVSDEEFARALAAAARLDANLHAHFRRQYKMDQVAALLADPDATDLSHETNETTAEALAESAFVPTVPTPDEPHRVAGSRPERVSRGWWKWAVAACLLITTGVAFLTLVPMGGQRLQLVSGRIAVAGQTVTKIVTVREFDVIGPDSAVIEFTGGGRVELAPGTRAEIRDGLSKPVLKLISGGGEIHIADGSPFRVETSLGVVSATDAKFTVNLVTTPSERSSSSALERVPRLTIAVAAGSVTVIQNGTAVTINAGEQRSFFEVT